MIRKEMEQEFFFELKTWEWGISYVGLYMYLMSTESSRAFCLMEIIIEHFHQYNTIAIIICRYYFDIYMTVLFLFDMLAVEIIMGKFGMIQVFFLLF